MTGLDPEKHLTIDQTAKALGVSRRTVYRYISEGLLGCFKHAGRNYVDAAQIEDYFARLLGSGDKERAQRAKRSRNG
jgi:excisionase family DNA binding protein